MLLAQEHNRWKGCDWSENQTHVGIKQEKTCLPDSKHMFMFASLQPTKNHVTAFETQI